MLGQKTTFLLGAGSSFDYGFPLGTQLVTQAALAADFKIEGGKPTAGDPDFQRMLEAKFGRAGLDPYYAAAVKLARRVKAYRSIDDFLFANSSDEQLMELSKMAIVHRIAASERSSHLARLWGGMDENHGWAMLDRSWAHTLMQILATGIKTSDVGHVFDKMTIISFCYDRCIETTLIHGLRRAHGLTTDEASALVGRKLRVFRPVRKPRPSADDDHRTKRAFRA